MEILFLATGILILIFTTLLGSTILLNLGTSGIFYNFTAMINFGVWIFSIVLIVIGLKKRSKRLKKKEDELQELKDKVERLEKEKEKKD